MSKNLQPEIRFKGFSDDWSNVSFFSLIDKIIDFRGKTPKKIGLDWSKEGYLALSALNVKNGYIDFNLDANYGDQYLYQKWMDGNELRKGQVLFTTEAPMGNVAQVPDNKGYILSQRTIAFNPNYKKITDDFLAVLLRSQKVFNKLTALSSGGTAKGVSQKSLENLEVEISNSLEEQQQIGDFFQSIDKDIALQEEKLNKTKNLKKAMLEKMFPKEGSKQPEVRFDGFSGDWEEKKISDVLRIRSGMSQKNVEISDGVYPILATGGIIGRTNTALYSKESVLIGRKGTIDKPYYMNTPFWTVDTLFYSELSDNVDVFFIYTLFQKIAWRNYNTSTGVPSLTSSAIHAIDIIVPSDKEEQLYISKYFRKLDDAITLQSEQLEKLKNIKKAYLAKMFV